MFEFAATGSQAALPCQGGNHKNSLIRISALSPSPSSSGDCCIRSSQSFWPVATAHWCMHNSQRINSKTIVTKQYLMYEGHRKVTDDHLGYAERDAKKLHNRNARRGTEGRYGHSAKRHEKTKRPCRKKHKQTYYHSLHCN